MTERKLDRPASTAAQRSMSRQLHPNSDVRFADRAIGYVEFTCAIEAKIVNSIRYNLSAKLFRQVRKESCFWSLQGRSIGLLVRRLGHASRRRHWAAWRSCTCATTGPSRCLYGDAQTAAPACLGLSNYQRDPSLRPTPRVNRPACRCYIRPMSAVTRLSFFAPAKIAAVVADQYTPTPKKAREKPAVQMRCAR
jgi:hypothetical protein